MDYKRLKGLLEDVLNFEFEDLDGQDPKEWAMDMFRITEKEYNEIFEEEKTKEPTTADLIYSNNILISKVNTLQEMNRKLIQEKTNKVYVLTIVDLDKNYGGMINTLVFETLDKAKEHLERMKNEFLANTDLDEEESVIEEEEMSWTWYYDGYYNTSHYSLRIEEKEIL